MARSDLLISLVRAAASGDRDTVRTTAEALAADERAKKHFGLAERLRRALAVEVSPPTLSTSSIATKANNSGRDTIHEVMPRVRFEDLILTLPVRESGRQLVEEHIRIDVLRAHGYEPRHKILLSGPPGNGKTSFAEAIAESLSLPFFVVRYDELIGSYLGETNTRLRKLFDYVRTQAAVLFFDEFDAIGKERGDSHETGEIKRVVSFLLMQLDQLPSYVIAIAATNHAELLDRAVWRRFQLRLAMPSPGHSQIQQLVEQTILSWPESPKMAAREISRRLGLVSYAEVVDFCQNVRRRNILGIGEVGIDEALAVELELWSARVKPGELNAKRPRNAAVKAKRKATANTYQRKAKKLAKK